MITLSSDFDFLSSYAHSVRRIVVVPPQISEGRSAPQLSRSAPRDMLMYSPDKRPCFLAGKSDSTMLRGWLRGVSYLLRFATVHHYSGYSLFGFPRHRLKSYLLKCIKCAKRNHVLLVAIISRKIHARKVVHTMA